MPETCLNKFSLMTAMALVLVPCVALADRPAPVLYCKPGEGCAAGEAQISEAGAGVLFGQSVTPGEATIVYLSGTQAPSLVPMAPDAVHKAYGGDGKMARLAFLPGEAGGDDAIVVFAPGDAGKEWIIDLYPDAANGDIIPRDGLWQVTSRDQKFTNCPAQMETMLRGSGMIDAQSETHRLVWGGRFDPSVLDFMNGEGQQVTWHRTGPNAFEGELFEVVSGAGKVGADVGMEITSPTQISSHVDLLIGAFIGVENLSALGLSNCAVYMTFDIQHLSD